MRRCFSSLSAGCGRGKTFAAALRGSRPRGAVGLGSGGGTYAAFPSQFALSELGGAPGSQHRGIEQLSLTKTQCGALPSALHPVVRHKWPLPLLPPARFPRCPADASVPPQCVPVPASPPHAPDGQEAERGRPGPGEALAICAHAFGRLWVRDAPSPSLLTAWGW